MALLPCELAQEQCKSGEASSAPQQREAVPDLKTACDRAFAEAGPFGADTIETEEAVETVKDLQFNEQLNKYSLPRGLDISKDLWVS